MSSASATSTNPPQPTQSSSPILDNLSQHIHGELPVYQAQPIQLIASEKVLISTVSDS